jgi:hypothetical protein
VAIPPVAGSTVSGIVSVIPQLVSSVIDLFIPTNKACCCPCVVYGNIRSQFKGKPDECVQDAAIFFFSSYCCIAPALGAINRYEMREKYNIVGLHQSETAGAKPYFEGKANNEILGKRDGHGLISVLSFMALLIVGFGYLVLLWKLCSLSREEGIG